MISHRRASWIPLFLFVLLFLAAPAAAEEADEIIRKAREAAGATEETLLRVIVADARCSGPGGEFETKISSAPKGNLWFRQSREGQPPYAALITPEGSFRLFKDGTQEPMGPRVALMLQSHDFQRIAIDPYSFARELHYMEDASYDGVACRRVDGLIGDGAFIHFFFDEKTDLMRGFELDDPAQQGNLVKIVYQDWRMIEGVKLPSVVVALDGDGEFVLDFHTIEFEEVLPPEGEE